MSVQEIHVVQHIWLLENSMAVIMGPDMSFSYKQLSFAEWQSRNQLSPFHLEFLENSTSRGIALLVWKFLSPVLLKIRENAV